MKIGKIKGTKDILHEEIESFLQAEKKLREVMEKYNYREIRTPIFEHTELFVKGTGEHTDIVKKEMYNLTDRGGRNLTLRPEGTPSIVRAYIENNFYKKRLFQKFFYYGHMFRQESPQSGRQREFHQFGIEAIGSISPQVDVETVLLGLEVLSEIGLQNIEVQINSIGCKKCRPTYKKVLRQFLQPKLDKLCEDCQRRFDTNILRTLDCKKKSCQRQLKNAPKHTDYLCDECRNHFAEVKELLQKSNVNFSFNPYLVRGLDYYTKTVYEFISPVLGAQDAVGGGGRYDDMVELFGGPSIPAIGFACGMERILLAMEKEGNIGKQNKKLQCYIATMDEKTNKAGFLLMGKLRNLDLNCEKDYLNRSLKAQMKDANKLNAQFVIIIGTEELNTNQATLKRMSDGLQKRIKFSAKEILKEVKNLSKNNEKSLH
jgi:histidyl-tRNA synthetase